MDTVTTDSAVQSGDLTAAKALFVHIRERLDIITGDLISLGEALTGPPGSLAELADDLLGGATCGECARLDPGRCPGHIELSAWYTRKRGPS